MLIRSHRNDEYTCSRIARETTLTTNVARLCANNIGKVNADDALMNGGTICISTLEINKLFLLYPAQLEILLAIST